MTVKKNFFILFVLFFLITGVSKSETIAFINLDKVVRETDIGNKTFKKIEKINNNNIQNLKKKQNELKILDEEIQKKKNIVSEDELNKEISSLNEKIKKYNIEKDQLVSEFNELKSNEIDILMNKITPIIQEYMRKNSIKIVLDRKNIFIGSVELDLSDIIIQEINKLAK